MKPEFKPNVRTVQTADFEMDYVRFGVGRRPLVIIPGLSLHAITPAADGIAERYADFLSEYTVYLFDRKKRLPPVYSNEECAEDTARAMQSLGLKSVCLFGASQGGMIAMCMAIRFPELVDRLAVCSTLARPNPFMRKVFLGWIEAARAGDVRALNRDFAERLYTPAFRQRFEQALRAAESLGTPEECARFATQSEAILRFDIYDQLDRIRCPVLVLGSRRDQVFTGRASEEIAEKLGCELYLYDDYAHAVYDEAPDYLRRIRAFFDQSTTDRE